MSPIKQFFPKTMLGQQGHTLKEVEVKLRVNLERYKVVLGYLTSAQCFAPVAPNKWTPAEITDHLYRANQYHEAVAQLCRGNPPLVLPLGKLTEEGTMVTEAALPDVGGKVLLQAVEMLSVGVEDLIAAAQRAEHLDKVGGVCLTSGFFGPLTGLERLQLASAHIAHHTRQLPNLA
ncbi:MAG: hypothetical protein AVDCRST_MAG86-3796 [uncultured Truepera sp.]|uniref:DinB-like domain-containing protein n=1 Tax=uncultured Truepera sp. TaxID=543023 RepID=A0A6J4VRY6_9DEIN|nr:MAG: hypothetical protein AVDCRST_MAG86-3796 [uncultured Truepera sp.]